jgi:hypothetical protein
MLVISMEGGGYQMATGDAQRTRKHVELRLTQESAEALRELVNEQRDDQEQRGNGGVWHALDSALIAAHVAVE